MLKKRLPKLLLTASILPFVASHSAQAEVSDKSSSPSRESVTNGATTIDADQLEIYLDKELHAKGDAILRTDGQAIFGDQIDYNLLNHELKANGNVRVEQNGDVTTGPALKMKLDERVGEMQSPTFMLNAKPVEANVNPLNSKTILRPSFSRGTASEMAFEGPDKEHLKDVRYTTCEVGKDDWFLRAKDLELDHYTGTATAKHASIEFQGVPILYTPWIDFPFVSQRKSGLLAPTFGTTSRSGVELQTPFYWNIAPNMDATVGTRVLSKRGIQLQGEYRYLNENYRGIDNLEFLPQDDLTGRNRFYGKFKHDQIFGNGFSGGFQYERVSDNQYFSDLSTHIITTSRVNLAQQAYLNYSTEHWSFSGLAQQYQTLDGVSYPYKRVPQLTLNGNKDWDLFSGNLYSQFVRFEQSKNAVPSVTGNRLTVYPNITIPFSRSFGYVTPKLGLNYTQYDLGGIRTFNLNGTTAQYDSDTRALPVFSVDSGMYFDRNFRVIKNAYIQTLEPRMYYVYIPYHDQSKTPIFDTGLADVNLGTLFSENQYTGNDRVNNANQLSLALTSRIIDEKTGIQRLAATVGQRFYFVDQKVTLPGETPRSDNSSDLVAALTARLLNHWNVDTGWQYNTSSDRTIKSNIGLRYNPEPGRTLNLSYRFTKDNLEQVNMSSEWPLGGGWYGLGRWNYSLREKKPIEAIAGFEYNAGCWLGRAVVQRVSTATANANYALFFQLELGGLASIGTSPLDLIKRSIQGYSATSAIPETIQQQQF